MPYPKEISVGVATSTASHEKNDVYVSLQPISLCLVDAAKVAGLPVWTLREAVMTGELRAKRGGRLHIILISELDRWIHALDDVAPSSAPSILARVAKGQHKSLEVAA